jgi:thiol-disulfide isomerase/thioredoxin
LKTKFSVILLGCFIVLALLFAVQCGATKSSSGSSGGSSVYQKFCNEIEACQLGGVIQVTTMAECLTYAQSVSGTLGNCVVDAQNCAAATNCFAGVDDDDDATPADDDDNDDSTPNNSIPELNSPTLYLSALDFEMFSEANAVNNSVGTHERGLIALSFLDKGCDLAGGKMYYELDGGAATDYGMIPSYVKCSDSQDGNNLFGYDLTQMTGAMALGSHTLHLYWTDKVGNQSNTVGFDYTVADTAYTLGATMADFTENDEDGNPISLSDYTGDAVLIDGFAQWCEYCRDEAGELATDMANYHAAGSPVAIMGLMNQLNDGSSDITQAALESWVTTYGWSGTGWAIHCLADGSPSVQQAYWWEDAYPFNMVLDVNHVIRIKWHGYGSGLADQAIQWVLAHPNPPEPAE